MPPTVAIILVSWNTRELLRRALQSIRDHAALPVHVVVVDNASGDGSPKMVRAEFPEATVIVNPDNRGFGQANNQGFAAGDEPLVLLLNSDAELTPGALPSLVGELRRHPDTGAVGGRLVFPDGRSQADHYDFPTLTSYALELAGMPRFAFESDRRNRAKPQPQDSRPVDWVSGACILLRRDALKAVVRFDPSYHMYSEEMDLCHRLWDSGWAVRYSPAATVLHHVGQSADQRQLEQPRLLWESRLLYFSRFQPVWKHCVLSLLIVLGYSIRGFVWFGHSRFGPKAERTRWRLRSKAAWHVVTSIRPIATYQIPGDDGVS